MIQCLPGDIFFIHDSMEPEIKKTWKNGFIWTKSMVYEKLFLFEMFTLNINENYFKMISRLKYDSS